MMKHTNVRKAWLYAGASAFAITAAAPGLALAQDQDADEGQQVAQADTDDQVDLIEELVVTGSRIRRTELDLLQPTQVLTGETIDRNAFANVGDALNELPILAGGTSSLLDGAGASSLGTTFLDLFNLGTNRTLTLVNGRRFVSSNVPIGLSGQQVDVGQIPTALIERTDIVTVGGAPIYGADAIAGTINIILRDDFEGVTADGQFGFSPKNGIDAEDGRARILMGANFDDGRGNVTFAIEYNRRDGVAFEDREFTAIGAQFVPNPEDTGPDDGIPDQIIAFDALHVPSLTFGGVPFLSDPAFGVGLPPSNPNDFFADAAPVPQFSGFLPLVQNPNGPGALQFAPNGDLVAFNPGTFVDGVFAQGGEAFALEEVDVLTSDQERLQFYGTLNYEIFDGVNFFAEGSFSNNEAVAPAEQGFFSSRVVGGGDQNALIFDATNPFLTPQAQSVFAGLGVTQFGLGRLNNDLVNNGAFEQSFQTFRVVAGFEGEFELFGRNFYWDVAVNNGTTRATFQTSDVVDLNFFNAIDAVQLTQADIDAIASSANNDLDLLVGAQAGDIVCAAQLDAAVNGPPVFTGPNGQPNLNATTDNAQAALTNCVPINLFGLNGPSQAAIDFVSITTNDVGDIFQTTVTANFGGELVELPAGMVSFNTGIEFRREGSSLDFDGSSEVGIAEALPSIDIEGRFDQIDYYGEASIPLFGGDFSFIGLNSMIVEGSFRVTDNNTFGSATVFSAGGRWSPYEGVQFRGNFTRSVRTPSVDELFTPFQQAQAFVGDPCEFDDRLAGPNPTLRQENCDFVLGEQIGVADPASFEAVSDNVITTGATAGNLDLDPERSNAFTIGVVLEPDFGFLNGFTLTADLVDVFVTDAIVNLSGTAAANACFDSPGASAFATTGPCSLITRETDPSAFNFGSINSFLSGPVNAGFFDFRGIQIQYQYQGFDIADVTTGLPMPGFLQNRDLGRVSFQGSAFNTRRLNISTTGIDLNEEAGEVGDANWQVNFDLLYNLGRFAWSWRTRFTGSVVDNVQEPDEAESDTVIDRFVTYNTTFSYRFTENLSTRLVVNNIFDKEPEINAVAFGAQNFYSPLGRTIFFGATLNF